MRIGILTYHRAHNYGAVLQCYALQQVLKDMGHSVEVIDYRQPYIENKYKPHLNIRRIISSLVHLNISGAESQFMKFFNSFTLRKNFTSFRETFLNCSSHVVNNVIPEDYDCYIIGSDQMWGLHCTGGDEPIYWGKFKRKPESKLIGYAISSNRDYTRHLSLVEIAERVRNFDALSLRELAVCEEIQAIAKRKFQLCLDPTLLTKSNLWKPLLNNKYENRKIVATYFIRENKLVRKELLKKAINFANSNHLELIDLSTMKFPVEDFISIIKSATCVFTTSFHATVFSVIFGIPFTSICLRDGHDDRYVDLLSSLGLSDHLADITANFTMPKSENIQDIERRLKELRQSSIQFLQDNI